MTTPEEDLPADEGDSPALAALPRIEDGQQQGIQSVEIGAHVLRALERGRGPMSLSEVARGSGMQPAKVHRYLVSLVRAGLVAREARTGRYDLGAAARRLGVEALRRTDVESIVSSHAMQLRDESGHTVDVAVWSDAGPVIVQWASGRYALPMVVRVGSVLPLLDSALGLVFLAHLPRALTGPALLAQQERHETRRIGAEEQRALMDDVHAHGFVGVLGSMIHGLAAFGAPVFGADETVVAAMGLAVPARLVVEHRTDGLADLLLDAAAGASAALGSARPETAVARRALDG